MSNYFTPATLPMPPSQRGEPAWEIAMLFPPQGHWTEEEYLALDTNHRVELVGGCIEVHPMVTVAHQLILGFLLRWLGDHVKHDNLGLVVCAPFPVKIVPATYREPDIVFLRRGRVKDVNARSVVGADLVLEVVS